MVKNDFHLEISVAASPEDAFNRIHQVDKWWAKSVIGSSQNVNDAFRVVFGETFVDFLITASIPGKMITWLVTDCNLHWIQHKKEWKGQEVIFELVPTKEGTYIKFTHIGLIPGCECYEDCKLGWTEHISDSLVQWIDRGNGHPQ